MQAQTSFPLGFVCFVVVYLPWVGLGFRRRYESLCARRPGMPHISPSHAHITRIGDHHPESTMASSATTSPTATTTASLNRYNWANIVGYIINVLVTFGIGVFGGGIFGVDIPDIGEISETYQTLITPIGWTFSIWGVIFIAQFIWVVIPLIVKHQRNNRWIMAVGYKYLFTCLIQATWTIVFGLEYITISLVVMLAIWSFLFLIVIALYRAASGNGSDNNDNNTLTTTKATRGPRTSASTSSSSIPSVCTYLLWFFPFTVHLGWITVAATLNANILLMVIASSRENDKQQWMEEATAALLFLASIVTVLALILAAIITSIYNETIVPFVIAWAFLGVYFELRAPSVDSIVETYTERQINTIKNAAIVASVIIIVIGTIKALMSCCCCCHSIQSIRRQQQQQSLSDEHYRRAPNY